jgi:hypothetical protein
MWVPILSGYYEANLQGQIRRLRPGQSTWVGRPVEYSTTSSGWEYAHLRAGENQRRVTRHEIIELVRRKSGRVRRNGQWHPIYYGAYEATPSGDIRRRTPAQSTYVGRPLAYHTTRWGRDFVVLSCRGRKRVVTRGQVIAMVARAR